MPEPPARQGKDVKTSRTGHLLSSPPARPSPGPATGCGRHGSAIGRRRTDAWFDPTPRNDINSKEANVAKQNTKQTGRREVVRMAAHTRQRRHESLPARGVWIEMYRTRHHGRYAPSHSPQGECGLKFLDRLVKRSVPGSLSLRRAWIEIGVCSVPATAWMSLSLFMSSVLRTCGDDSACAGLLVSMTI